MLIQGGSREQSDLERLRRRCWIRRIWDFLWFFGLGELSVGHLDGCFLLFPRLTAGDPINKATGRDDRELPRLDPLDERRVPLGDD